MFTSSIKTLATENENFLIRRAEKINDDGSVKEWYLSLFCETLTPNHGAKCRWPFEGEHCGF
jgi:hypothetical protein